MAINQGLLSSKTVEWYTPAWLTERIDRFFFPDGIVLDPCADPGRSVPAWRHYAPPEQNGLLLPWDASTVYVNPGYGRGVRAWIEKFCTEPFGEGILLVPARTDTRWFAPLFAYPICFLKGRLKFSGSENSAPFPSALVYRGEREVAFAEAFDDLGPVVARMLLQAALAGVDRSDQRVA